MTTTAATDRAIAAANWLKLGFYTTSIIFNICLIAQVLTVGVAYFTNSKWWNIPVSRELFNRSDAMTGS
ncbi:hypothetical protein [Pseudanabaena sp. UWO310]|uniref:hypothetical protein n=1 Tax=Pseudanabaena sp. UWO310 TaxID=2480795 RepID=UPI00115A0BEC|nr:hypothetical protein [Pseudanabaena sp. UWO310]TYQ31126.1 hypothetical protein PseudUWO310_05110 [Pseudanabaena sp. UWO310]